MEGTVLEVYTEGREIIDVDTNEPLGKTETLIARIKVEKVSPTISYAKLVDGELSKLSGGLICRAQKGEEKIIEGLKSEMERTPGGGVKLPFD